jgi:flagellar biosynthetic protein FlhB
MRAAGVRMFQGMKTLVQGSLSSLHSTSIAPENLGYLAAFYGKQFVSICLPMAVTVASVGIAVNVLQVGFKVTPKAIAPKFSNMNPIQGLAKLVTIRGVVELLKSVAKILVVAWFAYSFLKAEFPSLLDLPGMPLAQMGGTIAGLAWRLMMRGVIAMLIIGIIDYIYQKRAFENSIKMTKQEVFEEMKQSEGDPQVKGQIKAKQREIARRRMMRDVPKADVIITNPTHFAVAIRYDADTMAAPTVIAKGQRLMALKIRSIAEAHGIPIIENPPVARLIYRTVEIGEAIPEELYQTVAEILAYVFQMSKRKSA